MRDLHERLSRAIGGSANILSEAKVENTAIEKERSLVFSVRLKDGSSQREVDAAFKAIEDQYEKIEAKHMRDGELDMERCDPVIMSNPPRVECKVRLTLGFSDYATTDQFWDDVKIMGIRFKKK